MSSGAADVICPRCNMVRLEWQNMLSPRACACIVTLNFLGRRWLWTLHCAATYSNSIAQTRGKSGRGAHLTETQNIRKFDSRELPVTVPSRPASSRSLFTRSFA